MYVIHQYHFYYNFDRCRMSNKVLDLQNLLLYSDLVLEKEIAEEEKYDVIVILSGHVC